MKFLSALPHFEPHKYEKLAMNELIVFAVFKLQSFLPEISAEDIVAACFTMFPVKFHLRGYPDWPDSTVVNKRWLDCRRLELLEGSTAKGFSLTPKGITQAEKTYKKLNINAPITGLETPSGESSQKTETRTRAGRFVRSLETSDAFQEYRNSGNINGIGEFDFRSMLLCNMDSPKSSLLKSMIQFEQCCRLYDRKDLVEFLALCSRKFSHITNDSSGDERRGVQPGMLPKRITNRGVRK